MASEEESDRPPTPAAPVGMAAGGRAAGQPSRGGGPGEGGASASRTTAEGEPALTGKREYPAHSDGIVCRCAVHWRRETLARGLHRLFAEDEETAP